MIARRKLLILSAAAAAGALALPTGSYAQQKTIKIGFIGPLSGGNAHHGLAARNGYQLAVRHANAAGLPFACCRMCGMPTGGRSAPNDCCRKCGSSTA